MLRWTEHRLCNQTYLNWNLLSEENNTYHMGVVSERDVGSGTYGALKSVFELKSMY